MHSKSRAGMLAGSAVCVESVDEQKDTQLVTTAQGFEELGGSYQSGSGFVILYDQSLP